MYVLMNLVTDQQKFIKKKIKPCLFHTAVWRAGWGPCCRLSGLRL